MVEELELGILLPEEPEFLTNRYFPSKVGGRPAWLELKELPTKEQLQCGKCKQAKNFICQIYAPFEYDQAFHRSLYVFACRTAECQLENNAHNITVLRSQLAQENDFYPSSIDSDNETSRTALPAIPTKVRLCAACGCPGPSACGRCKLVNYCSLQHQRSHWPHHKKFCGVKNSIEHNIDLPGIIFTQQSIDLISDGDDDDYDDTTDCDDDDLEDSISASKKLKSDSKTREQVRMAEYEELTSVGKIGKLDELTEAELNEYTEGAVAVDDKFFRGFKKAVMTEPSQVLRYQRGGQPLWITDLAPSTIQQIESVPKCPLCNGDRQFEFQIMPQLLLTLNDDVIDWGVIAIYTCANSCAINRYVVEHAIKQDIQLPEEVEVGTA